jgi:hypothetical protein
MIGQTERTVRSKLAKLKALGFVDIELRHDHNRERLPSRITLRIDRMPDHLRVVPAFDGAA